MSLPTSEIQSLSPSALLELFVLDATPCGGGVYYFHAGTNELGTAVIWQGQTYQPFPVQAEGFEWSSKGTLPRPKLTVAALDGMIGGLVRDLEDLVGAKVVLKRCFAKHLDASNFTGGNPDADPTACYPDEPWIVERKTLETADLIAFELATPIDVQNARIPARRIHANVCGWNDSPVCPFSSGQLCAKTLAACKTHAATDGAALPEFAGGLPFGAFPGTARIR